MKNRYITAYAVTRHYGGPEEGGWWYNWYRVLETIIIPKKYHREKKRSLNAVRIREKALQLKLDHINEGNIYHVAGGVQLVTCIECVQHENETTERPYYC
jgi:hypothetical protein